MALIFFISTLIFAYLYFEEKRKNKQYGTATQTVVNEATVSAEANPVMAATQPQVQIKTSKLEEAQEYWAEQKLKEKSIENFAVILFKIMGILFLMYFISYVFKH